MSLLKKCIAECIGTAVLVLFACGVAAYTGPSTDNAAAMVATALAFGLVIVAMAYSIGNVSGCHINPAVSLGCAMDKRISWKEFGAYVGAQVVGAFVGAFLLALFLGSFENLGGNAIQPAVEEAYESYGVQVVIACVAEIVLTFVFVIAVLGATDSRYHSGKYAGLVIGLTLTLVHLLGLPITGTSVNPARSLAPAILQIIGGSYASAQQIYIWILAPMAGAALAALVYKALTKNKDTKALCKLSDDNAAEAPAEDAAEEKTDEAAD